MQEAWQRRAPIRAEQGGHGWTANNQPCALVMRTYRMYLPVPVKRPSPGMLYLVSPNQPGILGVGGWVVEKRLPPRHAGGAHGKSGSSADAPETRAWRSTAQRAEASEFETNGGAPRLWFQTTGTHYDSVPGFPVLCADAQFSSSQPGIRRAFDYRSGTNVPVDAHAWRWGFFKIRKQQIYYYIYNRWVGLVRSIDLRTDHGCIVWKVELPAHTCVLRLHC